MLKKGVLWVGGGNALRSVIQIVLIAVISRLIAPAEFGKFAVLLVIINFVNIFNQIGIAPALIQKKELSFFEIKDSFIFTIIYSLAISLIYLILVPFYLEFLEQDDLFLQSIFMVLFFPMNALSAISEAKYKRDLRFRPIVQKNIISLTIGYGMVTILLGYFDFGIWALVFGFLAQSVLLLLLYYKNFVLISDFSFRFKNIKSIVVFGIGNSLSNLFNYLGEEGDKFLFSKFYNMELLGAYSRAYQLFVYPSRFFGHTFDTIFFPLFSKNQEDKVFLKRTYTISIRASFSFLLPISFIMSVYADKIIYFLLGSQWGKAVPLFSILILGLAFRFSTKVSKSVIKAINEVYRLSAIQFITACIIIFGILFTIDLGYLFVPYIITSTNIINFALVLFLLSTQLRIGLGEIIFLILPSLLILIILILLQQFIFPLFNFFWYFESILFCLVVVVLIISNPIFFIGFSLKNLRLSEIKEILKINQ